MSAGRLRYKAGHRDLFSPYVIPSALKYLECDFERTPQFTVTDNAIETFTGPYGTKPAFTNATAADRPLYAATFNSRPCGVFDGTDYLQNATAIATLGWPASGAFEIWALIEYTGSGSTQNVIFSYPAGTNTGASLSVAATTGVRFRVGTGSASVILDTAVAAGRHVVRAVSTGTTIRLDVDGVEGTPVACVAAFSGSARSTIGGFAQAVPTGLFTGKMNFLGFYKPLADLYALALYNLLDFRRTAPDLAAFPWADEDLISDFEYSEVPGGQFHSGSLGTVTAADAITCVRASTNTPAFDRNGRLVKFAADTPRITLGRGLSVETTRSVTVDYNGDLDVAEAWEKVNCTVVKDLPSPFADNSVPGCRLLVTADGDATCLQSILPIGATESMPDCLVFLPAGMTPHGPIEITQDGALWTDVRAQLITNGYVQVGGAVQPVTGANHIVGIRLKNAHAGDSIGFMLARVGRGYTMGTPGYTSGAATVNANSDVVTQNTANFPAIHTLPSLTVLVACRPRMMPLPAIDDRVHPRSGGTVFELNNPYNIVAEGRGNVRSVDDPTLGQIGVMTISTYTSGSFDVGLRVPVGTGVASRSDIMAQLTSTEPGGELGKRGTYWVYSDLYPLGQNTVGSDIVIQARTKTAQGLALNWAQKPDDPDRPGIIRIGLTVTSEPDMNDFGNDPQTEDLQLNEVNVFGFTIDLVNKTGFVVLNGDIEPLNPAQYTHSPVFTSDYVINHGSQYPSGGPIDGDIFRTMISGGYYSSADLSAASLAALTKYRGS